MDKPGLEAVKLGDKTTAAYKLRSGLAPFFRNKLHQELDKCKFSLNLDEATSKTKVKVLAVMVSHFSPSAQRVVVNHLDAVVVTRVSAVDLMEALDDIFKKHKLKCAVIYMSNDQDY